jgi:predicted nucleic acid-binding protein
MAGAGEARPSFPRRAFCDTSYFYACADAADGHHRTALALASNAANRGTELWTTWDVVSETVTLLRYRHSYAAAIGFLDEVKPGLQIMGYGGALLTEAEDIFRRLNRDHRLSFCDAISFVVVTTLLDYMPCFAFDDDFRRLGLTVVTVPH